MRAHQKQFFCKETFGDHNSSDHFWFFYPISFFSASQGPQLPPRAYYFFLNISFIAYTFSVILKYYCSAAFRSTDFPQSFNTKIIVKRYLCAKHIMIIFCLILTKGEVLDINGGFSLTSLNVFVFVFFFSAKREF